MKKSIPKSQKSNNRKSNNVIRLVDNPKFKAKLAGGDSNLYFYTAVKNQFQFQPGDQIICRDYLGEKLSPNAIVINRSGDGMKTLTTVANASNILSVVVAYRREIENL